MDAFRAWHDLWKDRPAEEAVSEGPSEQTFLQASVHAQNWIADGGELEKIRSLCITSDCRSETGTYIRQWGEAVPVSIAESFEGNVGVSFAQYIPMSLDAARRRLLQLPRGSPAQMAAQFAHTGNRCVGRGDGERSGGARRVDYAFLNSARKPSCSKCRSLVRTSISPSRRIVSIEIQSVRLYPL